MLNDGEKLLKKVPPLFGNIERFLTQDFAAGNLCIDIPETNIFGTSKYLNIKIKKWADKMTEIKFHNPEKDNTKKLITFRLKENYNFVLIDEDYEAETLCREGVNVFEIDLLIDTLTEFGYKIVAIESVWKDELKC